MRQSLRCIVLFVLCTAAVPAAGMALPGGPAYLAAHEAEKEGQFASARQSYLACAHEDALLRPYAEVRAAICQAKGGDHAGGLEALAAFAAHNPGGPWVRMAQLERAQLLYEHRDYDLAGPAFRAALDIDLAPDWLLAHSWDAADALAQHTPTAAEGFEAYRTLLESSRSWRRQTEAALALTRSINLDLLLQATETLLDVREYREAGVVLDRLQTLPLLGPQGGAYLRYLRGRYLAGTGRGEMGRALLESVVEGQANSGLSRKAQAARVRSLLDERDTATGEAALDEFIKRYPGSKEGGDLLHGWARTLDDRAPLDAAAVFLRMANQFPDHTRAPDALWRAAWLQQDHGRRDAARLSFVQLGSQYPEDYDAPEAWYRAGKIALDAGETEAGWAAMRRAADGALGRFYTHRALDRLAEAGHDGGIAGSELSPEGVATVVRPRRGLTVAPPPLPDEWRRRPAIQRLLFFGAHGLEEAEWEALALAPLLAAGESAEPLMRAFAEAGVAASAMGYASTLGWGRQAGMPGPAALRAEFPLAYWEEAQKVGREMDMDPLLILAIARQESRFKARVVSSAGATGVMQLMPRTARWLADVDPVITSEIAANLTVPGNSLRMGARYFKRMLGRYDGNLVYAAGAYNAGPGNMNKWRRRLPNGGGDAFIDAIPFSETKGFIKHVLGNYGAYRSLYAP